MSGRTAYSTSTLWFLAGGLAGVGLAWLSDPSSSTRSSDLERNLRERVRTLLRSPEETVLRGDEGSPARSAD